MQTSFNSEYQSEYADFSESTQKDVADDSVVGIANAAAKIMTDSGRSVQVHKNSRGGKMGDGCNGGQGNHNGYAGSWKRVTKQLQTQLGTEVYNTWCGRLKFYAAEGGVVYLSVPTRFLKNWIASKYREQLLQLWQQEDSSVLRVDVIIRKPIVPSLADEENRSAQNNKGRSASSGSGHMSVPLRITDNTNAQRPLDQTTGFSGSPLDQKHTFETFIQGNSNRVVFAAATCIADDINASQFNPLIIHAGVGLGKTHVLQAIAGRARARNPKSKVLYLTAEYFMWRFASAIRDKTALTLKESLRDIDLLLIDDLQFLQGKAIQAEFCHLLNDLIDSARQVVVAADRPPTELESLDERVRSRLKGGVMLEISMPDYEMRKQILNTRYERAKLDQPGLEIPEDILHYVARQVASSGRRCRRCLQPIADTASVF